MKNKYDSLIVESMEQYRHENPEEKINTKWECVKTSIQIANTNLPVKENKKKQLWITDEVLSKITQRKQAKNTPEYASIEREIRQMCRAAKETWIQIKCKEIEDLEIKHNSKEVHENIKRFTKKKNNITGNGCIRGKNGEIIVDNSDIIERWKEYTEELFWDNRSNKPALQNSQDGPKILKAEVEKAIKNLKQGKAAGPDKITTEMIKSLANFGIDTITELCNDIYNTGYIPKDLKTSIFITLPKKPRAVECEDYRTISLMSHITKILLKVIQERIQNKIDEEVTEEQFGFRKNSGTREAIICLRMLIEKYIEVQKNIYVCFIDYKKAFDRVQHERLITCLQDIGVDGKDIRIIGNFYWEQVATVRYRNNYSSPIEIKRGVRQGCVLSPSLFNLYT